MSKKDYKNIIFFSNGSIGDFLMTIFFLENIHYQVKKGVNLYIAVPRMSRFLAGFLDTYPYINLIEINKKKPLSFFRLFFAKLFSKNAVVIHHTYGTIPFFVKLSSKMLAIGSRSRVFGFKDKAPKLLNNFIFDNLVEFDIKSSYIKNLARLLYTMGFELVKSTPDFTFENQSFVSNQLKFNVKTYIVIHPFAASRGRSLPLDRWNDLVKFIISNTDLNIVITGSSKDEENIKSVLYGLIKNKRIKTVLNSSATQVAELISHSKLYIGVDTGITHLACFLSHPSVVIGQLSNPSWLPYYNNNAIILFNNKNCTCRGDKTGSGYVKEGGVLYPRCMYEISQDEIKNTIMEIYKKLYDGRKNI